MEGPMAQMLTRRTKGELTQVLTQAFAEHPMVGALGAGAEDVKALTEALVGFHWRMDSLLLCGISTDEGLLCGSLSVDSREDASLLALARLAWDVTRSLGWRAIGPLLDVERHKPLVRERHLELVMLGTSPAHQRQGLGRRLLHSLYKEAIRAGYTGIVLVVDRDTPAFGLYRSEGFEMERRFEVGQQRLCWMRRAV